MPVPAAVPKNLIAVGAVVAAGRVIGKPLTVLVRVVGVQVVTQVPVTEVMVDAVVGRVLAPLVSVVEVIEMDQPGAEAS